MSAVFEIKVRLPYMLHKGWWGEKPSKKLKLHIPKPEHSRQTFCGQGLCGNPNYHTENVESHSADLNNDLCLICLSRALARQRKIGNGSVPGGYYDQN